LFAFLADLDNHRLFADRYIDVVRLHGEPGARHGGEVHIRGPFGLRRIARTTVLARHAPHVLAGRAEIGRRTVAHVSWTLHPHGGSTNLELTTTVTAAGMLDRLLLIVGGRQWLRWRIRATLATLTGLVVPSTL
jgi:hypothetical protein